MGAPYKATDRITLRSGDRVHRFALDLVSALKCAGFNIFLQDGGQRFTIQPASEIPPLVTRLLDQNIPLRESVLAVLADWDAPPAA